MDEIRVKPNKIKYSDFKNIKVLEGESGKIITEKIILV